MISIARLDSEFGEIEVLEYRARKLFFYVQGGCFQTEADRNGIGLSPYVHAIFGLLKQSKAQDVLMIGCGGGCLGTMLAKAGVQVTVVDKNPVAFEIARGYFCLPAAVRCHVADGREFLLGTHHQYDAIVLDAYDGDKIPAHLQTSKFFDLVRSHLDEPGGCFVSNVHALHDLDRAPDRYAATAHRTWRDVRLLDTRGVMGRNALVVAGNVRNLQQPSLHMPPLLDRQEIISALANMRFRPWQCR
ncbi:spermidine synthase [Reyranella sp.]|uniref:spermidine synthase n=1 Tax=Reyranella sp. TaxID=1929291 RepID=UPI003D12342E